MKRALTAFLAFLVATIAVRVGSQELTELEDCVGDVDVDHFCSDSTAVLVDAGCDTVFNRYHGQIAWPVLRCVGPVTIAVQTRVLTDLNSTTRFPLYIEIIPRDGPGEECRRGLGGFVVLVAKGGPVCGGTWESIGPLDLRRYGVQLGGYYSVQAVFIETLPTVSLGRVFHSVGFACIRLTAHPTAVTQTGWGRVKALFRE